MIEEEKIALPSYRAQTPEVAERFKEIRKRPVILDVENLTRIFPSDDGEVVAINEISFRIHRREFICIVGSSGCGKSTLIRNLAGLDHPTSGSIKVDNNLVKSPGPDRGMVFQSYTLFPWLTVKRNVMFGRQMAGENFGQAEADAKQWIELVGLTKFENAYPHQLSGGMKQRVAIARALANQPRILLMDEPFGALDAQTRAQMQSYLLKIWHNIDVTIVFITHDLEEAVYLADRILVLKSHPGEIQEFMEVPVHRPRHPDQFITAPFLSTVRHIRDLIHPPSEIEEEPIPLPRMTPVGDDVE